MLMIELDCGETAFICAECSPHGAVKGTKLDVLRLDSSLKV